MKIKTNETEEFKAIEITLTIESEAELESLWHRFNITPSVVKSGSNYWREDKINVLPDYDIFSVINSIAKKRGLKK